MPIYTYICKSCKCGWESFHSISSRGNERCAKCDDKATLTIENTAKPVVLNYYSDALGVHVTGPKQLKRTMEEKDVERVG